MTAEKLRKVRGGVIGCFTPKETVVDFAEDNTMGTIGDHNVGIKVPAGKFVYGAYVKGDADIAGATATVAVKVGTTTAVGAAVIADTGNAALLAKPVYNKEEREVAITVAVAALTAGKATVGVIYG